MKRALFLLILIMLFTGLGATILAQDAAETPQETGVDIAWPRPISEVWQNVTILGTANVEDMAFYFIEAAPLNDDLSMPENAIWIPITQGSSVPVVNGILGQVDTQNAEDGLYALRLAVYTTDGQVFTDVVAPIRLSNERFEIIRAYILEQVGVEETPTPEPTEEPVTEDQAPRVTPLPQHNSVNVRRCDLVDNQACPVIGFLNRGQEAPVLARSANGTGWFQIQIPSGSVGWVSNTVVAQIGDFSSVPFVAPPAPIPPPTPAPASNISIPTINIQPPSPVCNQTFFVNVTVANTGNAAAPAGTVTVQNVHIRTGTIASTGFGNYPSIAPGGSFAVVVPMTVTVYFNEDHMVRATAGSAQATQTYRLQQGSCGVEVNPTPTTAPPFEETFPPGTCTLNLTSGTPYFAFPNGPQTGTITVGGQFPGISVARVDGALWYQFQHIDTGVIAWVRETNVASATGTCTLPGSPAVPLN